MFTENETTVHYSRYNTTIYNKQIYFKFQTQLIHFRQKNYLIIDVCNI